ncbi:MAG: glycerate kinase [Cyanobacteria bacterium SZAS TMP-1]|nr:glycerate kinase [Cyanobacteria bacterium SZAS TMP-1]
MSLKILVAPASYKGSIAAFRLATVVTGACLNPSRAYPKDHHLYVDCEVKEAPIADGGDDTLTSLHQALGGRLVTSEVIGPKGEPVTAGFLILEPGAEAIVELAQASGIAYLSDKELAPLTAHTYGTGQLIGRAIAGGARRIVIAVGGSASTDGGTGALAALGAKFLDGNNKPVALGGGGLAEIAAIDLEQLRQTVAGVEFIVATDVTSPLLGPEGAAAVFGPQKGASAADVLTLDAGLKHFADVLRGHRDFAAYDEQQFTQGLVQLPGAGAAGGAGFGFAALLRAKIVSGFHFLSDLIGLEEKLAWCDIVVVAEGRLDSQTMTGKGVGEIIRGAAALNKTILALPASSLLTEAEIRSFLTRENLPAGRFYLQPTAAAEAGAVNGIATEDTVAQATIAGMKRILQSSSILP